MIPGARALQIRIMWFDLKASMQEQWRGRVTPFLARVRANWRKPNPVTLGLILEIVFLLVWAWLFARPYLEMDPNMYPDGIDWPLQIHFNHVWTRVQECGACAMWNGSTGGGAPAFADIFSSVLHPFVIVTTWLWDVRNGSKALLFLIFFMGGFAQWWLARVMGLGTVARLWAGAMAVVAGNLAGRMQMGWINAALSMAACALVLPAIVLVAQSPKWRSTVLLGLTLGLAALAGQGYMQLGLIFTLPAALVLVPWRTLLARRVLIRYVVAAGLALLIAAPFIVPFAASLSQFAKAEDTTFQGAIHFGYMPLMFVTNDFDFLRSKELGMQGYPALYTNYIGFLPFVFFVLGIRGARQGSQWRAVIYLMLTGVLALWLASLEPRLFVAEHFPDSWLSDLNQRIRSAPIIAGLAVPAVLGVAAVGLDFVWRRFSAWVSVGLQESDAGPARRVNLRWLLVLVLLWSLLNARTEGMKWMAMLELRPETYPVLNALKTPDMQWVAFPQQNFYLEPAVGMGLKIPWAGLPEFWKDKTLPPMYREALLNKSSEKGQLLKEIDGVGIFQLGENQAYAIITNDAEQFAKCAAQGRAGDIDVQCNTVFDGVLTVRENYWAGWNATLDGKSVKLLPGRWLQVDVPKGAHIVELRYRPLDFPSGIVLCFIGLGLAVYLWFKREPEDVVPERSVSTLDASESNLSVRSDA